MTDKLIIIKGYRLPGEDVWVTETDMYEVYGRITLSIDGGDNSEMIITSITDEGLFVQSLQ